MNRYFGGLIAGLTATFAISVLILAKSLLSFAPELELVGMPSRTLGVTLEVAWLVHVLIGAAWGLLFAAVASRIPSQNWAGRGAIFGFLAWLVMMVLVLPAAGTGMFGFHFGLIHPATTLALHLVFGVVLGVAYGWLTSTHDRGRFVFH